MTACKSIQFLELPPVYIQMKLGHNLAKPYLQHLGHFILHLIRRQEYALMTFFSLSEQVLNKLDEFEDAVKKTLRDVRLDNDIVVSVFETNIRVLG